MFRKKRCEVVFESFLSPDPQDVSLAFVSATDRTEQGLKQFVERRFFNAKRDQLFERDAPILQACMVNL